MSTRQINRLKINKFLEKYGKKRIDEAIFSFIDFETTGLSPSSGDRICEIAILKSKGGEIIDSFHTLINPGRQISAGAQAVNNITDEMVENAPCFREIAQDVLTFIEDSIIVAHNASFDMKFLLCELGALGISIPDNSVMDTLVIARRHYNFPSNSLGNLAEYYGIQTSNLHRSMADVEVTKQLFDIFLDHFSVKGIETIEQLVPLISSIFKYLKKNNTIIPSMLDEIIIKKEKVAIKYLTFYGEITERVIEPIEVQSNGNYFYLSAFCYLKNAKLIFRIDRIIEIKKM